MAASLPTPMSTPSRSVSRTIQWTTPRPLVSSDSESDTDYEPLPSYSVTLNKRTTRVPANLFASGPPPIDTSVQLEFNTNCDVDVTLCAGNIDVRLQSPDKASTMHLTRRQSDGTWNVQMRKDAGVAAVAAVAFEVPHEKESKVSLHRALLAQAGPAARELFATLTTKWRDLVGTFVFVVILVNLLPAYYGQEEFRGYS